MAIYLVRHAHAGSRSSWLGDDGERPLSPTGRDQAAGLVRLLGDRPIGEVWSSPARRCTETAEPLAADRGLEVQTTRSLEEGTDAEATVAFLRSRLAHDAVLVSHGDVIPKVIRQLSAAGMHSDGAKACAKGSVWVLESAGDEVVTGTYHPPAVASD